MGESGHRRRRDRPRSGSRPGSWNRTGGDETDAEAARASRTAASAAAGRTTPRRVRRDAELLAAPGHAAADRPVRPAEPPGGLVEGEALEVAKYDRQTEGPRQPIDLVVHALGLLAGDHWPVGRRDRRLGRAHGPVVEHARGPFMRRPPPAGAGEPIWCLRTSRRADRDAVEPVAQQVGVADRTGLPGQDEEGGLEGVLGDAARHRGAGGRRPAPSARAAPRAPRRRPRRLRRARRRCTAPGAAGRTAPPPSPPSKSVPSCRTTDPVATCVIPGRSLDVAAIAAGAPCARRRPSLIPSSGTVAPRAELSRVSQ